MLSWSLPVTPDLQIPCHFQGLGKALRTGWAEVLADLLSGENSETCMLVSSLFLSHVSPHHNAPRRRLTPLAMLLCSLTLARSIS